jgi:hypothetical protein
MKRSAAYKYSLLKVGEIKNEGIFRVRLPAYIMNYLLLSAVKRNTKFVG